MKLTSLLIASLIALIPMKKANAQLGSQDQKVFKAKVTEKYELKYLLHLPADYDAKAKKGWPLLLFLHGAGERGTDVTKVAVHGPPKLVKQGTHFPFIVASPQCPTDQRWNDQSLLALIDMLCKKYKVDSDRIYLTGLSMGGFGSWSLASKYPERFAAVAPICGGGEIIDVLLAPKNKQTAMKNLGIWAFHGAKDPVVPLSESQRMVDAFKRVGCKDIQLTVYPEHQHDSWTDSYANQKLWDWFLTHKRK